jgi:UDP-glucose 4-epimerase
VEGVVVASVVLVTGVSRYMGGLFARALGAVDEVERIIGVDVVPRSSARPGSTRSST